MKIDNHMKLEEIYPNEKPYLLSRLRDEENIKGILKYVEVINKDVQSNDQPSTETPGDTRYD